MKVAKSSTDLNTCDFSLSVCFTSPENNGCPSMYRSWRRVNSPFRVTLAFSAGIASASSSGAVRMTNGRSALRSVMYTDACGLSPDVSITPARYAHDVVEKLIKGGMGQMVSRSSFSTQNDSALHPLMTCGCSHDTGRC